MAVTYPNVFTEFSDSELALNQPVSEELIRKFVQNCNMLKKIACVGQLRMMALHVPNVPAPSSDQFLPANGTSVTDLASPLYTQTTPNLDGKYIMSSNDTTTNSVVGSSGQNLEHTHGAVGAGGPGTGTTGTYCVISALQDGNGGGNAAFSCHNHIIYQAKNGDPFSVNTTPHYVILPIYMKVK